MFIDILNPPYFYFKQIVIYESLFPNILSYMFYVNLGSNGNIINFNTENPDIKYELYV